MAMRASARYAFGLVFARLMALNDDKTIPTPDRVIGGAGPFDFSGAPAPAAVPLTVKLDNGVAITVTVNLTVGVADITAVTVAELVVRINATATEVLASAEPVTGRLMLEYDGTETPTYMQVYGLCATLAMVGQGFGCRFIKLDTAKNVSDTPTVKAEETITTTDAKGLDTEVITDGYRKGFTATLVDTARDPELRAIMEGGAYDAVTGIYEAPTSTSAKVYFFLELYYDLYNEGSNKEADLVGYVRKLYRSCKGSVGQAQHQRGWTDGNYEVVGTSYTDELGAVHGDVQETELTVPQYTALDLANV